MENFVEQSSFVPLNQTIFTSDQQHMKEEDFPFEVIDQSKPTSFLQDYHHLDHHHDHTFDHHHHHGSSSSNPLLSIQTMSSCNNNAPFQHFSYQENMVDFYESKPQLMNHHHHPYFTHDHHHHNINVVDEHDPMGMEHNNMMMMMRMIPFDYPPKEIIINKPMNFVMQDEVSCVSADNNDCYKAMTFNKTKPFLTRKLSSSSSSSTTWKGNKKTTLVKGQWTSEEDRVLIQLVEKYGLRKWSHIAQVLPGRIGKQCRERWHNHLRPDIKKETWSEEEDKVLIESHKEIGNKWAEIAKRLPGRTENSIKNHWNATKRRQFSKRKCRSKYPRPSLLQDYIKSLDLGVLSSSSVPARGRRKEKKDVVVMVKKKKEEAVEMYEQDSVVPECHVFTDDFGFDEKLLLEEGCSIDSLLDDIPQLGLDAFVHGI